MNKLRTSLILLALAAAQFCSAAEPANYYKSCEGLTGKNLLVKLCDVVGNHTVVSYNGLWDLYETTDLRSNGTIWDMYSTKEYRFGKDQCGSYSVVGSCYNREHSFPKSWFNDASPMVSDAFHIYPTDGKVNGQRSNYPYGECANGTTLPASGGIRALGRLGSSTFSGYSGTVFEPDDEYKGDFARTYFYMAAAYNGKIASWDSPMLAGNNYPAYTTWAVNLLLKWHRQDPVSDKEINRNNAVYAAQKNRNPFIDHPELAEYIWGNKQGTAWYINGDPDPELTLPVDGSTIDLGTTVVGYPRSSTFTVKGTALESAVTLSVGDANFSVSPASIIASQAANGATATVTFNALSEGTFNSVVTVASGSLSSRVKVSGKAISTLPVGPVNAISDCSFVARWSNVGDADAMGEYTLDVQLNGVSLDEFPRSVTAADEAFLVEGLEASTTYTYYIKSQHLTSEVINVTTLDPQPLIEFLFDGDLNFVTSPGEPSEAAELLVNIENINTNVIVSVSEPFQLSTDKATWSTSLTLDPEEDRIYLRLLSDATGTFHTSIIARAGEYYTDQAEAVGNVVAAVNFFEDFETGTATTYNKQQYQGSACLWNFVNTGIWDVRTEAYEGNYGVRFGKSSSDTSIGTASIEMAEEHIGGMGVLTFMAKIYSNDINATIAVEYTTDNGNTWQSAATVDLTSNVYSKFTVTINQSKPVRLRFTRTVGNRVNIDNIEATAYSSLVPESVADYHRWDAFCRDGQLCIEADEPVLAHVYALDGTTLFSAIVPAGITTLDVPTGLCIVAVDDFARRVLIK